MEAAGAPQAPATGPRLAAPPAPGEWSARRWAAAGRAAGRRTGEERLRELGRAAAASVPLAQRVRVAAVLKQSYCLKGAEIQQKAPGPSSPRWRFAHLENRQVRSVGGEPGNHHPGNSQTDPDQVLNPGSAGRWQGTVSSLFRDFQTPATPGRERLSEHCTRPRPQMPGVPLLSLL